MPDSRTTALRRQLGETRRRLSDAELQLADAEKALSVAERRFATADRRLQRAEEAWGQAQQIRDEARRDRYQARQERDRTAQRVRRVRLRTEDLARRVGDWLTEVCELQNRLPVWQAEPNEARERDACARIRKELWHDSRGLEFLEAIPPLTSAPTTALRRVGTVQVRAQ